MMHPLGWSPSFIGLLVLVSANLLSSAQQERQEDAWVPWRWSRAITAANSGQGPTARQGHAAVEMGRKVYVIGGCVQEITCYNDVWILDTSTLKWTKENITGEPPEPRGGHSATLLGTDVFIVGGANSEETFGDVHRLDLIRRVWTRALPAPNGHAPSRRTNHAAVADAHGRIYVFGGYDDKGNFLDDLWVLNARGPFPSVYGLWAEPAMWAVPPAYGDLPDAREGHSLTVVDKRLVLFGGYTAQGHVTDDVHVYDVDTQKWTKLAPGGAGPAPRQAHSASRHGRDIVIAGGCDVSEVRSQCFNDVWSLSLVDGTWSRRSEDSITWIPREGHTATFVRGKMYLFGGCELGSECFNDTTILDTYQPCPAGCGGHGECVNSEFCRCSVAGFTGHDCLEPLTCQKDCGEHGLCTQTGQCVCASGWKGDKCNVRAEIVVSDASSAEPNLASDIPVAAAAPAPSAAQPQSKMLPAALQKRSKPNPKVLPKGLQKMLFRQAHSNPVKRPVAAIQLQKQAAKRRRAEPASESSQFGVGQVAEEIEEVKAEEEEEIECVDSCNFRGLCDGGQCYCQPGFYGESCQIVRDVAASTISILVVVLVSAVVLLITFITTVIVLYVRQNQTRGTEKRNGFTV